MTRHAQDSRRRQSRDEGGEQQEAAAAQDLRDGQLDEDVACCLAEIDKILDEEESERDRAVREFRELRGISDWDDFTRAERVWQAQYAHLGLRIASGCCTVELYDEETGETVERL